MKFTPSEVSRDTVQVVLRDSTSISPDCSAVKRSLADSGTNLTLVGIVEDRSGDRAADVDVEPGPVALVVRRREARQALADAAGQHAAVLDRLEGLRGGLGRETGGKGEGKTRDTRFMARPFKGRPEIVF